MLLLLMIVGGSSPVLSAILACVERLQFGYLRMGCRKLVGVYRAAAIVGVELQRGRAGVARRFQGGVGQGVDARGVHAVVGGGRGTGGVVGG